MIAFREAFFLFETDLERGDGGENQGYLASLQEGGRPQA